MSRQTIRFKLSKTLYQRDYVLLVCPQCDRTIRKLKYLPRPTSQINTQYCVKCKISVKVLVYDQLIEVGSLDDGIIRTRISTQELDDN